MRAPFGPFTTRRMLMTPLVGILSAMVKLPAALLVVVRVSSTRLSSWSRTIRSSLLLGGSLVPVAFRVEQVMPVIWMAVSAEAGAASSITSKAVPAPRSVRRRIFASRPFSLVGEADRDVVDQQVGPAREVGGDDLEPEGRALDVDELGDLEAVPMAVAQVEPGPEDGEAAAMEVLEDVDLPGDAGAGGLHPGGGHVGGALGPGGGDRGVGDARVGRRAAAEPDAGATLVGDVGQVDPCPADRLPAAEAGLEAGVADQVAWHGGGGRRGGVRRDRRAGAGLVRGWRGRDGGGRGGRDRRGRLRGRAGPEGAGGPAGDDREHQHEQEREDDREGAVPCDQRRGSRTCQVPRVGSGGHGETIPDYAI